MHFGAHHLIIFTSEPSLASRPSVVNMRVKLHQIALVGGFQLMINWWFGARWFGILLPDPEEFQSLSFSGDPRNPNHQFTINCWWFFPTHLKNSSQNFGSVLQIRMKIYIKKIKRNRLQSGPLNG